MPFTVHRYDAQRPVSARPADDFVGRLSELAPCLAVEPLGWTFTYISEAVVGVTRGPDAPPEQFVLGDTQTNQWALFPDTPFGPDPQGVLIRWTEL